MNDFIFFVVLGGNVAHIFLNQLRLPVVDFGQEINMAEINICDIVKPFEFLNVTQ